MNESEANNKLIFKFIGLGVVTLITCGTSFLCYAALAMSGDGLNASKITRLKTDVISNISSAGMPLVLCIGLPLILVLASVLLVLKKKSNNKLIWLVTLLPLLVLCIFIIFAFISLSRVQSLNFGS